jgi:hypothetical protein
LLLPCHFVPRHLASASTILFLGWRLRQLATLKQLKKHRLQTPLPALKLGGGGVRECTAFEGLLSWGG